MRLSILCFVAAMIAASAARADIDSALSGHWKCDNNAASTVVTATVGYNGTATNTGNTSVIHATGPSDSIPSCFLLDGVNDYINLSLPTNNTDVLRNTATFSLSAMIRTTETTAGRIVYCSTATNTHIRGALSVNASGTLSASSRGGDGDPTQTKTSSLTVNDDGWHLVTATFDMPNDEIKIYIDGVEDTSATGTIAFSDAITSDTAGASHRIGSDPGDVLYAGYVADVRIYKRELSSSDVTELYTFSMGTPPTITTSEAQELVENTTAVVDMEATGDTPITWSITGGDDATLVGIDSSTGEVSFLSAPDYETPLDAGANNVYEIQVTAANAAGSDVLLIYATVTDEAEGPPANYLDPLGSGPLP